MTREQYESISKWQREVFTKATPLSCAYHLNEESYELIEEMKKKINPDLSEIADCFLLLLGVCNMSGLTYDEVIKLIDDKMKINYERQWGKVNNQGYVKHI